MKGQMEITEMFIKIAVSAILIAFIAFGILSLTQFKTDIKENSKERLVIDLGENILAAHCLTDMKGVFNETKLRQQQCYKNAGNVKNDIDGISCIDSLLMSEVTINTENKEWYYGLGYYDIHSDEYASPSISKYTPEYEFPALVNMSDGSTAPAKLIIKYAHIDRCVYWYFGLGCYNCIEKENCEDAGCEWAGEYCRPEYSCAENCEWDNVCNRNCGGDECKADVDCCLGAPSEFALGEIVFSGECNSKDYEIVFEGVAADAVIVTIEEDGSPILDNGSDLHEVEDSESIIIENVEITLHDIILAEPIQNSKAVIGVKCV